MFEQQIASHVESNSEAFPREFVMAKIKEMITLPVENKHEREWRDPVTQQEERYLLRSATLNGLFGYVRMGLNVHAAKFNGSQDNITRDIADILSYRKTSTGALELDKPGDLTLEQVDLVIDLGKAVLAAEAGQEENSKQRLEDIQARITAFQQKNADLQKSAEY